jgi:cysteine desulfurase
MQPIDAIGRLCRRKGVLLHSDASQTIGKVPADVKTLGVDLMTITGHKIYAPQGTGALYVRQGVELAPFFFGGGQQRGRRAGTEAVMNWVVTLGCL